MDRGTDGKGYTGIKRKERVGWIGLEGFWSAIGSGQAGSQGVKGVVEKRHGCE